MTVLYFADTRFPIERANGAQTMATCVALAERDHAVTLVVRPDTAAVPRDPFVFYGHRPAPRLSVRHIASGGRVGTRRARFLLAAAGLARRTTGVVYTRDLGLASFLLQAPFTRRVPLVYESHGIADVVAAELPALLGRPEIAPSAAKLARLARRERRVWLKAAAYVTITRTLADDLAARFGARDRVFVVPDGARPVQTAPVWSAGAATAPRPLVAGYAGHLYPWKGVDVLVRAIALLPNAQAIIIGGHPSENDRARVEALAAELKVMGRVTFTGQVPATDVAARLSAATVLVLPNTASTISERYTSPLKLFEYLALGRPIVASDLPAIREVLTDGHTAILVPPGDPGALAAALERIAQDPSLAASLSDGARGLAPDYTWEARAKRIESALSAAVA